MTDPTKQPRQFLFRSIQSLVSRQTLAAASILFIVGLLVASAQPVPMTTLQNSNLMFPSFRLVTNGVSGLTNAPINLMVGSVSAKSARGGNVYLVGGRLWSRRYNGPGNSYDSAYALTVDGENNVIVTGPSRNIWADFITIKYSTKGVPLWTNRYDGPWHRNDYPYRIAVDRANNVYVGGVAQSTSNREDVVLVKYSKNGMAAWTNRFNTGQTNSVGLSDFSVDQWGNSYVLAHDADQTIPPFLCVKYNSAGRPVWTNRFRMTPGTPNYANAIKTDDAGNVFIAWVSGIYTSVIKYSTGGMALWTNFYTKDSVAVEMELDRFGNVYVAGDVWLTSDHDYFTIKYSNSGKPLWTNIMAGPTYQGGGVPLVTTDLSGNAFITGGSPGAGGNNADFTTVKVSPNGTKLWTRRFFETNTDNPHTVSAATDSAGNLYFSGHSGVSDLVDYYTVKYNPSGAVRWLQRYNSSDNRTDHATGMGVTRNGSVYVTGIAGIASNEDFATVAYTDYVLYKPPTNYVGTDSFSFIAFDHLGKSATNTVTISVRSKK